MVVMRDRVSKVLVTYLVRKHLVDPKDELELATIRGVNCILEARELDYLIEGISRPVKAMVVGANHAPRWIRVAGRAVALSR
jgi:hypothetical protein